MQALRATCGGEYKPGGIVGYPLENIYEEVAFLGYYLHWDRDAIMSMPHAERRIWCEEVSKINRKIVEDSSDIQR